LCVLVVDDHDVTLWGFQALLAGQPWVKRLLAARSAAEAVESVRRYTPSVALVDLFIGSDSGTRLCEQLRSLSPVTRILLMSGDRTVSTACAKSVGAFGFVPKSWKAEDIASAIRMVGLGRTVFPPVEHPRPNRLSEREWEVLQHLAVGSTNREIAATLCLSLHTVKDHTRSLYRKIEARNRAEAVLHAQRLGLVD
jgi:DNA-binding NarL/FixJ family response regulator